MEKARQKIAEAERMSEVWRRKSEVLERIVAEKDAELRRKQRAWQEEREYLLVQLTMALTREPTRERSESEARTSELTQEEVISEIDDEEEEKWSLDRVENGERVVDCLLCCTKGHRKVWRPCCGHYVCKRCMIELNRIRAVEKRNPNEPDRVKCPFDNTNQIYVGCSTDFIMINEEPQ